MALIRTTSLKRYPDVGELSIKDYKKFLGEAKKEFEGRWVKDIAYKEVLADFDQIKLLGTGAYGDVVLVKCRKNDRCYAMKIIEKETVIKYDQFKNLRNEKKVLQCINFPFTVYLHSCFQDNSYVYFVMPYVPLGLFDLLVESKEFSEDDAKFYVSQVVLAIEYLHYMDLIYRDLKPENMLIDERGFVKLTDFGFCKRISNKRTFTVCGTPEYIAPEVILQKGYGHAADWWSCGVLAYELVAGFPPFYGENHMKIYAKVLSSKYKVPNKFSPQLIDLLKNLITKDLTRRFGNLKNGPSDIKDHKWFMTVNWMAILNRSVNPPYKPKPPNTEEEKTSDKWTPLRSSVKDKYASIFEDF